MFMAHIANSNAGEGFSIDVANLDNKRMKTMALTIRSIKLCIN